MVSICIQSLHTYVPLCDVNETFLGFSCNLACYRHFSLKIFWIAFGHSLNAIFVRMDVEVHHVFLLNHENTYGLRNRARLVYS